MIAALLKSFAQLADPRVQRVMWLSVLLSVAVLAALILGAWFGFSHLSLTGHWWLDKVIDFAGGIGAVVLAWFLFPAAVSLIASFFLDSVAEAVEETHYPYLPPARHVPLGEEIAVGIRFTLVALAINIALLPVYLALLFFPPFYGVVFYAINGYLLGREYFELAALRRLPADEVRRVWRANRGWLVIGGIVVALLLSVPVVNLLAPIVGTAFMVHLFHGLRRGMPGERV